MNSVTASPRPLVVDDWSFVPRPQARGTRRLFCFPHAGGDVTAFTGLAAALAPGLEVWAVRLPGRGGRFCEPMPTAFDSLVAAATAGIGRHLRPGAVFYGQSLGALLAYEVARALPSAMRPNLVVPASASAPAAWTGTVPDGPGAAAELLRLCGLGELLLAAGTDAALRELALATIRADLAVCRDYRYRIQPVPGFAVNAVTGADDPMVGAAGPGRLGVHHDRPVHRLRRTWRAPAGHGRVHWTG